MKKKLEAELISIAHRVLQLKNKSDVEILFQETQKLYEKLAVLRFVENQFGDIKPTLGQTDWEAFFESALPAEEEVAPKKAAKKSKTPLDLKQENPEIIAAFVAESEKEEDATAFEITEAAAQAQHEKDSAETLVEAEMPQKISFEAVTEVSSEISNKGEEPTAAAAQISFEDLLGTNYAEPEFVKPSATETEAIEEEQHEIESTEVADEAPLETPFFSLDEAPELVLELPSTEAEDKKQEITPLFALTADEPKIATEAPSKGFVIGLNDRVGFIHQLFDGSPEDYNRVLSQLMTYHTFEEADAFIRDMVKPDYNNWEGKSEYEERFMDVVARKFQ
jgi:hypothetical protein